MNDQTKTQSDTKEEAYLDRNLAILALAKLAIKQGYNAGISHDPDNPDWPVVMIDLPTGQVGWHLPEYMIGEQWPKYTNKWDGHSLKTKQQRMSEFISQE